MVDYMGAIKKPFSDMKTLGIGAVLGAVPLVQLLVSGYALKTAEDVIKGKNSLRAWSMSDLGDYIIKVIMMFIISIVYLIIPMIIIGIGFGSAIMTAISGLATNPADLTSTIMASLGAGAPLILIGGLLLLIAAFLMPMANLKWLKSGSIGAAFGLGSIIKNALTLDYIVSLIVIMVYAFVLLIIVGIIGVILLLIPVIGFILYLLLSGALSFVLSTTAYSILAQTVK